MTALDKHWNDKSDDEIIAALSAITDYTDTSQEMICLEVEKRRLLGDQFRSFVLDQIRSRTDAKGANLQVLTLDVSKVSRLRARTQFAPRLFILPGLLLTTMGLASILNMGILGTNIILTTLGVLYLFLAVAMFKRPLSALVLILHAITTTCLALVVVHHVRGHDILSALVVASLALPGVVYCGAALRLKAAVRNLDPTAAKYGTALQAKYFQNWKDLKVMLALIGAFFAFVIGVLLAAVIPIVGAAVPLYIAPYFWILARRFATVGPRELHRRDQRASILYLRSFGDDKLRFTTRWEQLIPVLFFPWIRFFKRDVTFEESVVAGASAYGPVVALSEPGGNLTPIGAARESTLEGTWADTIDALIGDSAAVIAVIGNTPGLLWELGHLRARASIDKLLLIVPPIGRPELLRRAEAVFAALPEMSRVPHETLLDRGLVVFLQCSTEPLVIVSRSRNEADYFEAIRQGMPYVLSGPGADPAKSGGASLVSGAMKAT